MEFEQITQKMNELYKRKNSDYGNSFYKTLDEFGIVAALVRMEDKMNRLKNLYNNPNIETQVDESINDTLMDLANYAVMTLKWNES